MTHTLYTATIIEHNKNPLNWGMLDNPTHIKEEYNSICGDRVIVNLDIWGSIIKDIRWEAEGCAVCMASASMMSAEVKGLSIGEAITLSNLFSDMLTREDITTNLGELDKLIPIRDFPARITCALLPWTALKNAIESIHAP